MFNLRVVAGLGLAILLAGCATNAPRTPGGSYKVGAPYQIGGVWYYPKEQTDYNEVGLASWYGPGFHGHLTADGEVYDQRSLSAAHPTLPMPVNVRVTNLDNGRSLVVRVNDRGPFHPGRIIDVSERAAELLGFKDAGTTRVRVEYLSRADDDGVVMQASAQRSPRAQTNQKIAMAPVPNPVTPRQSPSAAPEIAMAPIANPASPPPLAAAQPEQIAMVPVANPPANAEPLDSAVEDLNRELAETPPAASSEATEAPTPASVIERMYVQVGAFTDASRAVALYNEVLGIGKALISPLDVGGQRIYRVRLGPISGGDEASRLTSNLRAHGHDGAKIVME